MSVAAWQVGADRNSGHQPAVHSDRVFPGGGGGDGGDRETGRRVRGGLQKGKCRITDPRIWRARRTMRTVTLLLFGLVSGTLLVLPAGGQGQLPGSDAWVPTTAEDAAIVTQCSQYTVRDVLPSPLVLDFISKKLESLCERAFPESPNGPKP